MCCSDKKLAILISSVVLVLSIVGFTLTLYGGLYSKQQCKLYNKTECVINKWILINQECSTCYNVAVGGHESCNNGNLRGYVVFNYVVDNKTYELQPGSVSWSCCGNGKQNTDKCMNEYFSIGQEYNCYYKISDPNIAMLDLDCGTGYLVFAGLFGLMSFGLLLFIVISCIVVIRRGKYKPLSIN